MSTQHTIRLLEAAITALSLAAVALREWQSSKVDSPPKSGPRRRTATRRLKRGKGRTSFPTRKALRKMEEAQAELKKATKEVANGGMSTP
jgi:hypothetical protein